MEIQLASKIHVELIEKMGGDWMIVSAARICTQSDTNLNHAKNGITEEKDAGLINYLMKHRHGTPFEHSCLTFLVKAPIFVFREWHRHRIGMSYNEESARYKELDPIFWIPNYERATIPTGTSARPQFTGGSLKQYNQVINLLNLSYIKSYECYKLIIEQGIAREVARACLPVGIYSSCWVTCNPRSLMNFLSLRTHDPEAKFVSYPQYEIEVAARACEKILADGWPLTYKAFCANGRVGP